MNNNKKGYTTVIAATVVTMVMSCGVSVHAQSSQEDKEIIAGYTYDSLTNQDTFSVDINWGSMNYTYNSNAIKTWNPETLQYEIIEDTPGTWICDEGANNITVTNHSSVGVSAAFGYTSLLEDITGNFQAVFGEITDNKIKLASAKGTQLAEAPSATAALNLISTSPFKNYEASNTRIGEVTVTLNSVPMYEVGSTVEYTSTDGNTYNCLVYSATSSSAVLIYVEHMNDASKGNQDTDMPKTKAILKCEEKGGRLIKLDELKYLGEKGIIEVDKYSNYYCQEYEIVKWYSEDYWFTQTQPYNWNDGDYFVTFDVTK